MYIFPVEWNPSILKTNSVTCSNMNEPGEHYDKSKAEKDKYFIFYLYVESVTMQLI